MAVQARLALRGAAERAAALGARDSAVGFLRLATAITNDPVERGEFELAATRSAGTAGVYAEAEDLAISAIADFTLAGDAVRVARANAERGSVVLYAGHLARARDLLVAALEEAPADMPDEARARLLANLSRAHMRLSQDVEAIATADQSLAIAEPLDLDDVVAEALTNKASALGRVGRWRNPRWSCRAPSTWPSAAASSGSRRGRAAISPAASSTTTRRDRHASATNFEFALRVGNRTLAVWIGTQLTAGLWLMGNDWDRALTIADRALAECQSLNDEGRVRSARSLILGARGESTDEDLEVLQRLALSTTDPGAASDVDSMRADRALLAGDVELACASYLRAAEYRSLAEVYLGEALRPAMWLRSISSGRSWPGWRTSRARSSGGRPPIWRLVAPRSPPSRAGRMHGDRRLRRCLETLPGAGGGLPVRPERRRRAGVVTSAPSRPQCGSTAATAREVLAGLGARPWLEWLDAGLAGRPQVVAVGEQAKAHGAQRLATARGDAPPEDVMPIPTRLSIVTLAVADVGRSVAFYQSLGWERCASSMDAIAWFRAHRLRTWASWAPGTLPSTVLAGASRGRFGGITLAINVETEEAVGAALDAAVAAGATLLKPATRAVRGGLSGYFADPDGHPWEVAHNPDFPIDAEGRVHIP